MCFRTMFWNNFAFFPLPERPSSTHVRRKGQNCGHINTGTAFFTFKSLKFVAVAYSSRSVFTIILCEVIQKLTRLIIHTISNFIITLPNHAFFWHKAPISHHFVNKWLRNEVIIFYLSVATLYLKWKMKIFEPKF